MNRTSPRALRSLLGIACCVAMTSCVAHRHTVGLGATGTGSAEARQYYALFGLLPVNSIDTQRLAPDLTSYTVETNFGFFDLLWAPFLLPLTMTSRTVVVRT